MASAANMTGRRRPAAPEDGRRRTDAARPCLTGLDAAGRKRMNRRIRAGRAVSPYRGVYAESDYWNGLNPRERMLHVMEALSRRHPEWVYAGLSAAAAMGLDYTWSLLRDETIHVASSPSRQGHTRTGADIIHTPSDEVRRVHFTVGDTTATVLTTPPARTLVDCALRYPFRLALGLFDAAFRAGLTSEEEILGVCDRMRADCGPVLRLLRYTDARSENGGESLCRGTLIEDGFVVPELQREFVDPANARNMRRVDFIWHTPQGRAIVLEYDGTRKYVDPEMTKRRDIQRIVADERERDAMLLRAGVTSVVHVTYDEVVDGRSLWNKLIEAGVPSAGRIPFYERG